MNVIVVIIAVFIRRMHSANPVIPLLFLSAVRVLSLCLSAQRPGLGTLPRWGTPLQSRV